MGVANSKAERCEALRLCKARKKFIKQAIDSRYNLAAAHVAYVQSLRNIGIALRRFAEAELLSEDKTPSHPSSSPPPPPGGGGTGGGHSDSAALPNASPHLPLVSTLSYMRSSGASVVTHSLNPSKISNSNRVFVDDGESLSFTMPPPPPPPPAAESGLSWDYFDPNDDTESFRFVGHDGFQVNFNDSSIQNHVHGKDGEFDGGFVTPPESMKTGPNGGEDDDMVGTRLPELDQSGLKEGEREDPSEFISHRAKDFLSSIKDIENDFFRASKSGQEVSRMLEANKIRVSYSDATGSSTSLCLDCFNGKTTLVSNEPSQVAKVITWKRSTSSHSSSSANPLTATSKDENDDNVSDFVEEFCMIAGSHSSTLERLYAWERKLYDEVKASECIRKEYERKCEQLRHQFAKDLKAHVMDKTRAVVKDLHSRIIVALHTVDSISKRIEKMRDEELQPQLNELIQGLMRMWKSMLECHHSQYITISLAYHSADKPTNHRAHPYPDGLEHEMERFGSTFADMVACQASYVESVHGWLQNCITQPRERVKGHRRAFSPRRALAPSIFVTCRDWSAALRTLPSQQLADATAAFLADLRRRSAAESAAELDVPPDTTSNLSLTAVLDCLTKFSEASLKMYEDIKQKTEIARNAYANYRPPPRAFSI